MAKQKEVKVGQVWTARVGGLYTTVKVDSVIIPDRDKSWNKNNKAKFGLTNLKTGRQLGARTAAFLRSKVKDI